MIYFLVEMYKKPYKKKRQSNKSFTLIEIVIALTIFTIGSVSLLALFMLGFDFTMRSMNLTKVAIYAQWKTEDIKRIGFPVAGEGPNTAFPAGFDPRFTYEVEVVNATAETPPGPAGLQRVTVTISWTHGGRNYNERFITYISDFTP